VKAIRSYEAKGVDGAEGLVYEDAPDAVPMIGDVLVEVKAAGITPTELLWPIRTCRAGHPRNPIIPSQEFSGVVRALGWGTAGFEVGDEVYGLIDGYRDGAAAELIAAEARDVALKPASLDFVESAAIPQAALTSWQAMYEHGKLERGQRVAIIGAGGGVGSIAVHLLARLGHRVTAISGRAELAGALEKLGAARVAGREAVVTQSGKGLDKESWAAAIDTVGGPMLAELLKKLRRYGAVAAVGNAGGIGFEGSVLPFILRGVTLFGIDSVMQPYEARVAAWEHLTTLFDADAYAPWVDEVPLADLPAAAERILKGGVRGRTIVDLGRG
jgi:putative YhdH/YhfP family quinone oxidoreductase